MNYKETLNLPRTTFPMKGNLAQKEPEIQQYWREIGLYELMLKKYEDSPLFVLHDGPPYANGDIHVGTAFNKILKDLIIKYKTMRGYKCPYVPGWDCHGQPIEHEVTKRLGNEKISKSEIRRRCKDYAMHFVERQSQQFQRLGVIGEFENPYLTLSPDYEVTNIKVFAELFKKGLIYRGRKPIHWCPTCVTALAEAEIEYEDKESDSIYVKFPIIDISGKHEFVGRKASFLIWTTTPWTLPANVAIALHPSLLYSLVEVDGEELIIASDRLEQVMSDIGITKYASRAETVGSELEGMRCAHPWFERKSVVVLADYVTLEQGTGCVHIAPGHGQEDYLTGLEYNLPSPMPVDDYGFFTAEAGPFAGMSLEEANPEIVKDLEEKGLLLASGKVTHTYPHCWRCKKPVVFRATPQWFIALDEKIDGGNTLREMAIDSIGQVNWIPNWSVNRIESMVRSRPDWCISRQRAWGVPIPILYCVNCGETIANESSFKAIETLIASEGADAWFEREPESFLPDNLTCPSCGGRNFRKEEDILDVWFESGVSHLAVLRRRKELSWPADLYVEGSDQHRGWFQSSLLLSIGYERKPPYRSVLTHGFTVDGEGKKMSKSLGNAIDPREVYSRSGADILRLWTASTDFSTDMPISEEILERTTEIYRRIRNTLRFLLGNTYDFNPATDAVKYTELAEIDRWMLSKLQSLIEKVTQLMEDCSFHQAVQALHLYCTVDLSAVYLDILKDRLYTSGKKSENRRAAQTVLFETLKTLLIMIAPVLAHTAEEAWLSIPENIRPSKSVHLMEWPEPNSEYKDESLEEKWERLMKIRERVYRALESARSAGLIGSGLEALVKIAARGSTYDFLKEFIDELPSVFIVSQVELVNLEKEARTGEGIITEDLEVFIEKARGEKCPRCWNYSETVGKNEIIPEVCLRCATTLKSFGSEN